MGYALVKIKPGVGMYQDFRFGRWMPGESNPTFVAEKSTKGNDVVWDCKAPGYGGKPYGNGSIYVYGFDAVEMLTPLLGFEPEVP